MIRFLHPTHRGTAWRSAAALTLLTAALLLLPRPAAAAAPDEDDIIDRTMDASSPYYYTSLMMRYNAGDETLTDEDYHYLYYGYAYQEEYKPLQTNPDLDRLLLLASGLDPDPPPWRRSKRSSPRGRPPSSATPSARRCST